MNKRLQKVRVDDEEIIILTTYPWKESSLWVEAFSARYGRVALLARSARKRTSESRGVVVPFVPLLASWYGDNELKTLHRIQWQGGYRMPQGKAIFSAMYVNELVLKLTAREDVSTELFIALKTVLAKIAHNENHAAALRFFEWQVLQTSGLAPTFTEDAYGWPIDAKEQYWLMAQSNPILLRDYAQDVQREGVLVSGACLLAIANGSLEESDLLQEALRLNRFILDGSLPEGIKSRQLLQQLQAYQR